MTLLSTLYNSSRILCSSLQHQTRSQLIQTSKSLPYVNFFGRQIRTQTHKYGSTRTGRRFFRWQKNSGTFTNYEILRGPFLFTVTFSSACIIGGTIWEYENMKNRAEYLRRWWNRRSQRQRESLQDWWQQVPESKQIFYLLLMTNIAVLLLTRVNSERIASFLVKYFISNFSGTPVQTSLPLVLSAFCHSGFIHLGVNMYCLSTFIVPEISQMGKEQFVASYLSTAALSGFGSFAHRVLSKRNGSSVGASGAVIAMLTMHIMKNPDDRLNIIFLPQISFSAERGIMGLALFEVIGILFLRNKFLRIDHAGHLAGIVSGYCLSHLGPREKKYILGVWEEVREKFGFSGPD